MLYVKTPEEVLATINSEFVPLNQTEPVPLTEAMGRILAEDITAKEYVPDFNRSTVDGFAVRSKDTFGCSDAIPAILPLQATVLMGEDADFTLQEGACAAVPTGGAIPQNADGVVMIEYTEDYGDATVGITKPAVPGMNMIFRGDDVYPGKVILQKGRVLSGADIGALAAIGCVQVQVVKQLIIGVISTGDELVPPDVKPGSGQVRDVNSSMLEAMLTDFGCKVINYGIVHDDERLLSQKTDEAIAHCDVILLSGGSSVGVKDATCRIIESAGRLLFHGIAIKPGKPTILGKTGQKPIVGLPGHPVAAYFITKLFVQPLIGRLTGRDMTAYTVTAKVTESISANHGRAQYYCCCLFHQDGEVYARPIRGKSGLITTLAGADGYFCIPRDCEGLPQNAEIQVTII